MATLAAKQPPSPSPSPLPSSPTLSVDDEEAAAPKAPRSRLHPALYIANWIFFSNLTIIFNKWIIDSAGFRYPILLTCWHLVFSTVATQVLARSTSLLDSRHKLPITPRLYLRTICPIGLFYSGSLVCSNLVYLYLSVAFIQMLKSVGPVAVLLASWAWRVADPSLAALTNVLVIVAGVAVASFGEIQFSLVGFLYQIAGIACEAVRIVMIQLMLSGQGLNMDPLVGLYYYAPVCAAMNLVVALVVELPVFDWGDLAAVGPGVLLLNALIAFLLNISSVFLIGKTSGLVMTLTGILKNILLIAVSVIIWQTQITFLQAFGYSIALAGLVYYSLGYDQLATAAAAAAAWTSATLGPAAPGRGGAILGARKLFLVGVAVLAAVFLLVVALQPYDSRVLASSFYQTQYKTT